MPGHMIRKRAAVHPDRDWIKDHLGLITDCHQMFVGIIRAKHGLIIVHECCHNLLKICFNEIVCR